MQLKRGRRRGSNFKSEETSLLVCTQAAFSIFKAPLNPL